MRAFVESCGYAPKVQRMQHDQSDVAPMTRHHYTTRLLARGSPLQAAIVLRHRNADSLSNYCASQDERRFVELAGVIHGS